MQLLKKMSKRDATTKLRALQELTAHIESLQTLQLGVGSVFVSAWGEAFRASVSSDANPGVRAALLTLMRLVVAKFRRLLQPIFPSILPAWIAAQGDPISSVSETASFTLQEALPTAAQRSKVVDRYGDDLRSYCDEILTALNSGENRENFQQNACCVLAVLSWLVETTGSASAISPVIDSPSKPLMLLARGPKAKKKSATMAEVPLKQVCELAIDVLAHMSTCTGGEADASRANNFAELSLLGIRKKEATAWDLALVLMRNGWHLAFADDFNKLADVVGDAVTSALPSGLLALLPLFHALPSRSCASVMFASKVLSRMKMSLYPKQGSENEDAESKRKSSSVSYILSAMPVYIEIYSFAYSSGSKRWFNEDNVEAQDQYMSEIAEKHVLPTVRIFISGQLPPMSKLQRQAGDETAKFRRRVVVGSKSDPVRENAVSIACSLEMLDERQLLSALPSLAKSFLEALQNGTREAMRRYEFVLDGLHELPLLSALTQSVVHEITTCTIKECLELRLSALSVTLTKAASLCLIEQGHEGPVLDSNRLVRKTLEYMKTLFAENKVNLGCEENAIFSDRIGDVFSWMYWAGLRSSSEDVMGEIWKALSGPFDDNERWVLLEGMIRRHQRRRDIEIFSPFIPMRSRFLEEQVLRGITAIEARENVPFAIKFVATATNPEGGAAMPLNVLQRVAEVVLGSVKRSGGKDMLLDEVIITLLRTPFERLEGEDSFHDMIAFSILRAAESEKVLAAILLLLEQLPFQQMMEEVKRMLDVWHKAISQSDSEYGTTSRIAVVGRIVAAMAQSSIDGACSLCQYILSWNDPNFTSDLLRTVPLHFIFGDGKGCAVQYKMFLDTASNASSVREGGAITDLLCKFLTTLDSGEVREISRLTSKRMLEGEQGSLPKILEVSIAVMSNVPDAKSAFEMICNDILSTFPTTTNGLSSKLEFARVPRIIYILVLQSCGSALAHFSNVVEEAVKCVRRDPFSEGAHTSINVLSAALLGWKQAAELDGTPSVVDEWLSDSISKTLIASRRSLERSLGATVLQVHALEAHAARLMASALKAIDKSDIENDDIRFWALRVRDLLESFEGYTDDGSSQEFLRWERLASTCGLGAELSGLREKECPLKPEIVEDILHLGAWAAVNLLPIIEGKDFQDYLQDNNLLESYREASCTLVLRAAENTVLVKSDGRIPTDVNLVYSLVPLLSNSSSHTRKAVLTLLAYTTVVDLPGKAAKAFPKEGFADESDEIRLVTQLMPEPLRKALQWCVKGDLDQSNEAGSAQELGFFLAWRLFLDIIRANESSSSSTGIDDAEDVSFRRVGITFLRANPDIYAEFFNRCTDVVVDGNKTERVAAGTAAAKALEAEERAAQGAQLAQQTSSDEDAAVGEEEEVPAIELNSMDAEVGHAAGIAFARALQRLPALSRQHVTDRLDRGTALRVESFVRKRISPLLVAAEIRKVKEWGAFGGGRNSTGEASSSAGPDVDGEGELHARGSVAGREVWATYTFSDVTLEIGMRLPDVFPLRTVEVEARSRIGMSEARWRKTLLGITTLLRAKDGTLAEAVELWRRNLDKTFQGAEECPICYSVLHLSTAALPKMQCRTCKNLFHADCMCKWFTKSNSSACPLCRSAF